MGDDKSTSAALKRKRPSERSSEDLRSLVGIGPQAWSAAEAQDRTQQLEEINEIYHILLDELYNSANLCVEKYQSFVRAYTWWRRMVIVGTSVVAAVNLLASAGHAQSSYPRIHNALPVTAAVCAVVLTLLANLESFYAYQNKAQVYRESRELFLDAARDMDRLWNTYVVPFPSDSFEAFSNASELYLRIVNQDRELRTKFKELAKTQPRPTK